MFATSGGKKNRLSATAERFCRRFSLTEIQLSTRDFNEGHVIGSGGFGKVYNGLIDNGQQTVAIKRLASNSNQGADEFTMEIETLSKLRHVNLVSLMGYCNENNEMILVYEYIPRGTLSDHLYKHSTSSYSYNCSSLTWNERLKICIGAGRGLDYLHTGISIIHRDVKSTNILLDENFTAKVSDFGLAKHLSANSSRSHVSTVVKGTFGYLDPTYFSTGRLTRESDTYAFGVVLLEVLCGRPAVDPGRGEDEMSLAMWVRERISKGKVEQIVDSNLRGEISTRCLKIFVEVATRCLHLEPKKRPTMAEIVARLQLSLKHQEETASTRNAFRFMPFNAFWNRGNRANGSPENEDALKDESTFDALSIFSFAELKKSTGNFSSKLLLGNGTYVRVYYGLLKSEHSAETNEIVVKRLFKLNSCLSDAEFMPKWSDPTKSSTLDWNARYTIILGIASGLHYLHEGSMTQIIHRRLQASHILLDENMNPQISNIGIAKLLLRHEAEETITMESQGYMAPEYLHDGRSSIKTDVYSFGILILEIVTGQRITSGVLTSEAWRSWHEDTSESLIEPELKGRCGVQTEMLKCIHLSLLCIQHKPEKRPSTGDVVRILCNGLCPSLPVPSEPAFYNPSSSTMDFDFHDHSED